MPYQFVAVGGLAPLFVLGVILMVVFWDGKVWALATPQRRRNTVVIALVLAAIVVPVTTYAFLSENCYPDWLCGAFGICGGC
jgi:hypothetical protein